jgi:hypothetical protein
MANSTPDRPDLTEETAQNTGARTAATDANPEISLEEARNAAAGEQPNAAGGTAPSSAEDSVPSRSDPYPSSIPSTDHPLPDDVDSEEVPQGSSESFANESDKYSH